MIVEQHLAGGRQNYIDLPWREFPHECVNWLMAHPAKRPIAVAITTERAGYRLITRRKAVIASRGS
jgi:hypothetical protein